MNKTGIVIILLCFLAAIAAVLWERRKIRKTMEEIERMLDAAMTGSFSETNFDESQLSALETKFAHYLSAAEASSRNVAQEKDKIKTLIADISHQTKTPIANLLLYSELLMEETLPASAKANVEALYKQSEKLRFLIDSLVKLSRLENGIISLTPQQAALQPLLESVVEQYAAKASEKGLSLRLQDTDAFAVFDFKWTAEALANIVDNAIKYTEHGTIRISAVSYEMFARIDISDTGSGILKLSKEDICSLLPLKGGSGAGRGRHRLIPCPTDHIRRGGVYQDCFRSGKRKYVFHISAEITTILSKLLDFIFRRKECGKIPMR